MFQHCLTRKILPFLCYSPVFLNLSLSLNILLIIIIPSLFHPTVLFLLSLLSASHSSHHFISFFFNTSGDHCLPISILPFSGSLLAILHSCLDPLSSLTLLSFPLFLSNLLLSLMYMSDFQKHCCEGFPRQLHWTVHIETMTNVLNHSGYPTPTHNPTQPSHSPPLIFSVPICSPSCERREKARGIEM